MRHTAWLPAPDPAGVHHDHSGSPEPLPGALMFGAHAAAVATGGILLAVADHPLRRSLLVAASISHRGPPPLPVF